MKRKPVLVGFEVKARWYATKKIQITLSDTLPNLLIRNIPPQKKCCYCYRKILIKFNTILLTNSLICKERLV